MVGVGVPELIVIVVVLFFIWLLPAIFFQRIAQKSNTDPSWMAWVPIANLYLVCKLARTSGWWVLLCLIPYIGFIFLLILFSRVPRCLGVTDSSRFLAAIPVVNYVYIGYLAFRQEREGALPSKSRWTKSTPVNAELRQDEYVVKEGGANLQKGIETVGGKLRLTNRRLLFKAHKFNIQGGITELNLSDIQSSHTCWTKFLGLIPIFPNSLAIYTNNGEEFRFVLLGRSEWAVAIETHRKH